MADRIGALARRTDTPRIPPVTPTGQSARVERHLDAFGDNPTGRPRRSSASTRRRKAKGGAQR